MPTLAYRRAPGIGGQHDRLRIRRTFPLSAPPRAQCSQAGRRIEVRWRVLAPVLLVLAATAGGFALARIEADRDALLVLAGGLALTAVTGALAATTERRRRALREVDRYFTLASEMVTLAGFDGYWTRVNPAVEAVLGYSEREALAIPVMDLVHPDDRERSEQETRRVMEGATTHGVELRLLCKDGSYKWIEWTATAIPEERMMYGVGRDVTERRRSEREQAALRRVATLVAGEASPVEIFGAATEEACRVLECEVVGLLRFEPDGTATLVAQSDTPWDPPPLGTRFTLDGDNVIVRVFRTGEPARVDDWTGSSGSVAAMATVLGVRSAVAAPVVVEERLWGTVVAATSQSEPLPLGMESRLGQFTGLVATAIANAEARGALSRLAEEQAALQRVAVLVAQQPSPDEVFAAVTDAVGPLLGADLAAMLAFRDDGTATVIAGWSDAGPTQLIGRRLPLDGDSAVARIFQTGAAARIDNYADAEGETAEIARELGVRSTVGAPIVVEGKLWGALTAAMQTEEPLPPHAEARIAAFTQLVATAVSNAQAHADLQRLADEQAALRRVATLVAAGKRPEEVFRAVAAEVGVLFGSDVGAIVRFEDDRTVTVLGDVGGPHVAGKRVTLDAGYVVDVVRQTGRSARFDTNDPSTADMPSLVRSLGLRCATASPIVVEGALWGAITTASRDGPLPSGAERRLTEFTELVATAVANTQAREHVVALAEEQGALRRVATLVAASAAPTDVVAAVTEEIALVLGADATLLCRADPDGAAVVVGTWGDNTPRLGTRIPQGGTNLTTIVLDTGQPARMESYDNATGDASEVARSHGLRSAVGAPILVEGGLWGLVIAGTTGDEPLPPNAEDRLAGFTELVATAIANTESKSELADSRRRIVAASDETRRQIERDLHDGTQQRLVSLGLALRAAEANVPSEQEDLHEELSRVAQGLADAVEDLQEISRGIHPAILSKGGLGPALRTLALRSAIVVDLDVATDVRLAQPIEIAAYYVASEALANAAKHSQASRVDVSLEQRDGSLLLSIRDDGVGGADATRGSGLVGLTDRVEALGGSIRVSSRPGEGTQITAELPLELELPRPA